MKKINKFLKIEYFFVILAIIFGSIFINVNPPFHSNDEDRHFLHAYHISEHGFLPELKVDSTMIGGEIPVNLTAVVRSFQGVPYHLGTKIKRSDVELRKSVPLLENNKRFETDHLANFFPIPYLPNVVAIKIGKKINSNPVALGKAARFGSLIFFILCMFFIIKLAPVFKTTLMAFALTPMVLYQMTSVTYDVFNYVISFFFVSLYLYYTFDKKAKLDLKAIILIILLTVLFNLTKAGYFLLPLILTLIPKEKIKVKFNPNYVKIGFAVIFLGLYFDPSFLWSSWFLSVKKDMIVESAGFQNDFFKSRGVRLTNIFSDPFLFIGNIWENLMHFKQNWAAGILGKFGYSYSELSQGFYITHGIALILIAFLDGNKEYTLNFKSKIALAIIGFGTFFLVIIGFYTLSPVGANMIFGFQGRYLIPAIPVLLLLLYNNKVVIPKWEENKHIFVSIYIIIILSFAIDKMYDLFYYAY